MDGNDAVRLELRQGNGRQDHVDGIDLFLRQGIARHGADDDDAVLEISFEPRFYEQGRPHAAGADDEARRMTMSFLMSMRFKAAPKWMAM